MSDATPGLGRGVERPDVGRVLTPVTHPLDDRGWEVVRPQDQGTTRGRRGEGSTTTPVAGPVDGRVGSVLE